MKIRIKQIWGFGILSILIAIYLLIFSMQKMVSENEVIEIYFADRVTAAHKILIDKYNEIHEGKIKVVPIDFPNFDFSTNERKEILARALRSKEDGIDLFAVDVIWVQRFAKWCEPLEQHFTEEDKDKILPVPLNASYSDGELVAIPLNLVPTVMYYRKDLVKKLISKDVLERIEKGITWEDFLKIGNSIKINNPYYIFPAANYEGLICSYTELLLSLNPNYFTEYGFYFNTPEAEKALQLLVDLVNKNKVSPEIVTEFTEIPSYAYFLENDALFIRGWITYDKDFKGSDFDYLSEDQLGKAPIPYFSEGTQASTLGGWSLMVSKFTDKKKEVIDFIKFMISEESQEIYYKESSYYPVIKKFYEDSLYLKKYPEIISVQSLIKSSVLRPQHIEYTRFSKIMSDYFQQAIKGKINVKDALSKTTAAIQLDRLIVDEYLD